MADNIAIMIVDRQHEHRQTLEQHHSRHQMMQRHHFGGGGAQHSKHPNPNQSQITMNEKRKRMNTTRIRIARYASHYSSQRKELGQRQISDGKIVFSNRPLRNSQRKRHRFHVLVHEKQVRIASWFFLKNRSIKRKQRERKISLLPTIFRTSGDPPFKSTGITSESLSGAENFFKRNNLSKQTPN